MQNPDSCLFQPVPDHQMTIRRVRCQVHYRFNTAVPAIIQHHLCEAVIRSPESGESADILKRAFVELKALFRSHQAIQSGEHQNMMC